MTSLKHSTMLVELAVKELQYKPDANHGFYQAVAGYISAHTNKLWVLESTSPGALPDTAGLSFPISGFANDATVTGSLQHILAECFAKHRPQYTVTTRWETGMRSGRQLILFNLMIKDKSGAEMFNESAALHGPDDSLVTPLPDEDKRSTTPASDSQPETISKLAESIPDSGDRSRNEPVYLMSAKATRFLLNGQALDRSLDDIRRVAVQQGWSDVQAYGQQLLFIS